VKKKRFLKFIIPITLVVALGIPIMGGCRAAAPAEVEPIKFLTVFPYSGLFGESAWGADRGHELAVEDINAAGGVLGRPLQMLRYDVVNWETENLVAAREYGLAQGVDMFETYFGVQALLEVFDGPSTGYIPAIQWHTTEPFAELVASDLERFYNQISFDDTGRNYGPNAYVSYCKALEEEFGFEWPNKKIGMVVSDLAYSQDIAQRFEALIEADPEWEIVYRSDFPFGGTEFGPQLAALRAEEPGLTMFIEVSGAGSAAFVMQFLTDPWNSIIHCQWGISEADFQTALGEKADGIMGQGHPVANPTKEHAEFAQRVYDRWGVASRGGEPAHYDYTWYWVEAIEAVGDVKDYRAIIDYMIDNHYVGYPERNPYGACFTFGPGGSNVCPCHHNDRVECPNLAPYITLSGGDVPCPLYGPTYGNNLHTHQSKWTSYGAWPHPIFINGYPTDEYMMMAYDYLPQEAALQERGCDFEVPPYFK